LFLSLPVFDVLLPVPEAYAVQYSRPSSPDASTGNWASTPLYEKIDETNASDSDTITSGQNPSSDSCEVTLSAVTDPQSSSGHFVRYRYRQQESGGGTPANLQLFVSLMEGAATRASWTHNMGNNDTSYHDAAQTLTAVQADSITNYGNLSLRFDATKTGGTKTNWGEVSWAEFEVPDEPAITVGTTGSQNLTMAIPSNDQHIGGAFTLVRNTGSGGVSQIVLTEISSVDANADLSDVKLYYETAGTCT
jgi:hypothetical protein